MKRKKLLSVVPRLVIALAIVASVAAFGLAQPAEKASDSSRYSEREAYISKLREWQDDTSSTKTGWLILEGRLVQPPYDIQTTDTSVTVNGLTVFCPKSRQRQEKPKDTSSSATGTYGVIKKALANFRALTETQGIAAARESTLAFMLRQELIDTAYFLYESRLRFRAVSDKYEEELSLSRPFIQTPEDSVKNAQGLLQLYANVLTIPLIEGGLVIIENGRRYGFSYPKSVTVLEQLRETVATIPDLEERIKRIQAILGTDKYGAKIATEFK